jgi:hypothetical protein
MRSVCVACVLRSCARFARVLGVFCAQTYGIKVGYGAGGPAGSGNVRLDGAAPAAAKSGCC